MMAVVESRRQYDKDFITIRVDISHDKYLSLNLSDFDFHNIYVYYFDSMSTRVREFRTVKSAEFYPNAKFILDPSLIPKHDKNENLECDLDTKSEIS